MPSKNSTRRHTPDTVEHAHRLYLDGVSLRDIADQVLPGVSGGYVTIHRWAVRDHWKEEKQDLADRQKEAVHDQMIGKVIETAHRHFKLADLGEDVLFEVLREWALFDEHGRVVGVKKNDKGYPIVGPRDFAALLSAFTALKRSSLGVTDALPREEMESVLGRGSVQVVEDHDPELLRQFGQYLALQAVEVPAADDTAGKPDDDKGLASIPSEADGVGGAPALLVPEGQDQVGRVDDVDVALQPGLGVVDAALAPVRPEDKRL